MIDLIEFCIFIENMISHRNGYHQSFKTVQKSSLYEITFEKGKCGPENYLGNRTRLPVYVLSRKNIRVSLNFQKCFSRVFIGAVQKIAFKMYNLNTSLQYHQIVWIFPAPDPHSFVPQPDLLIGIPIAMLNPLPSVIRQAVHPVGLERPFLFCHQNRPGQFFRQVFVCIQGKNVLKRSLANRKILLVDMVLERVLNEPNPMLFTN